MGRRPRVWLFDLDNTLHDASRDAMPAMSRAMDAYIRRELGVDAAAADELRRHYFHRYGATLLGLVRHHGVDAAHFLRDIHRLPGLEGQVRGHPHDLAALRRLPGLKVLLTNAPREYAVRVLRALGLERTFSAVLTIEDMAMFGELRPKPDGRMLRRLAARLRVHPAHCVLVEDTLVHQKSARRLAMRTVWMKRWLRAAAARGQLRDRAGMRPSYVDHRIGHLRELRRRLGADPG
jgi:putative hydrolase of the HAD superfamily